VPGVSQKTYDHEVASRGVFIIPGTSDVISDKTVEDLMSLSPAFAQKYNEAMIASEAH
jgi:hypothetical protein